jgi:hypothetical protein
MKASCARLSALVSVLGLLATPALAQMIGNPVYFNQSGGVGLTLNADYGRGLNNASGKANYFGGRATLGLPIVAITVGAGSAKASGGTAVTSFGGDAAVTVVKGPLVPVNVALQAGVGYSSVSGVKTMHVPAGVAVTFKVKSPGASVEPWVAPRVDYMHVSAGGASASQTKFGGSAGLNVGLPTGLGFHVALDYLNISGASPLTVGAGIHYAIKMPSLGPVGM